MDRRRIVFLTPGTPDKCDKCGGKMVIRTGKFGEFLACGNLSMLPC